MTLDLTKIDFRPFTYPAKRVAIFRSILASLPRGPLVDLGAGTCVFSDAADELGFAVTSIDARTERVPLEQLRWPFLQQDIRDVDLAPYATVCVLGLLYHLTLPHQLALLKKCRGKVVIVDTHCADSVDRSTTLRWLAGLPLIHVDQYVGKLYREPPGVCSSFGNGESFWHTETSLRRLFADHGFAVVKVAGSEFAPLRAFWLLTSHGQQKATVVPPSAPGGPPGPKAVPGATRPGNAS